MATVIDALVVTLGLDAAGYKKGQGEATAALKKTEGEATKTAKEMEARGKQAASYFGSIKTQVVGLLAAFTAGSGLKSFVSGIVGSDAAIGRMAKNVGMATGEVSAWQAVAERAGGSAGGMAGSIQNLSRGMQEMALTGQSSAIPFLTAAHVNLQKFFDTSTPMSEKLLLLSDAFQGLDPAKAQALGAGMGLDEGTINVLMQGRSAVMALLAEQEKIGHTNAQDAAAAIRLQSAWAALGQASEDLGRKILTNAAPVIERMSNALLRLSEWAATHRPMVEAMFWGLAVAATAFAAVLAAPVAGIAALSAGIGVAVAAIAVLYDDWRTWIDGGQSAFGEFWQFFADKWQESGQTVKAALAAVEALFGDTIATIKAGLQLIYALFFGTSGDIQVAWENLFAGFGRLINDFVDTIKNLGPVILNAFKSAFTGALGWVEGRLSKIWSAITGKGVEPVTPDSEGSNDGPSWFGRMKQRLGVGGGEASAAGGSTAVPGGAAGTASAGADIAQLMGLGWTREQATGIAANLQTESSGNHNAVGDSGQAYGLGQWHPDRQANFAKWAGHDIRQSTHQEQVAFVDQEMRHGSERGAGAELASAKTAAEAASIVSRKYERPADREGEASKRAALASRLMLAGGPSPDPSLVNGAAAKVASNTTTNQANTSTSSNEVHIASVTVNTQATDANGVAKDLHQAVRQQFAMATPANQGLSW